MAHVSIPDQTPRATYAVGATPQSGFAVPFPFFAATDLTVYVGGVAAVYTAVPVGSLQFSVAGTGSDDDGFSSGTISLGAAVASTTVVIERAVPYARTTDFPYPSATLNIRALNLQLDKFTAWIQQLKRDFGRAVRIDSAEADASLVLPAKADRAGRLLACDSDGNVIAVSGQPLGPGEKEAYWWGGQAGGTAAAQTITVIDPPTAYQDGQRFNFLAVAASTGATTLKVNGLAALPIRKAGGGTALAAADIPAAGALVAVTVADGGTTVRINNVVPAVDLAAYAAKAAANSFTEPQTVEKAATGDLLTIRSTDAGAAAMGIKLDRNSASPAAADSLGDVQIAGRDDAATARVFSILRGILRDPAAATAEGEFQILQLLAGSLTTALAIRNGLVVGGATGGFQGTGTVNGAGFYRNGAALPVQRAYDSGLQTITSGGLLTLAHGLAAVPAFVTADLECQTIDAGYAVGEVLAIGPFYDSGGAAGMSVRKDATNLLVRFTSTGTVFATVQAGGGTGTFLTNANWKLRVRAYV